MTLNFKHFNLKLISITALYKKIVQKSQCNAAKTNDRLCALGFRYNQQEVQKTAILLLHDYCPIRKFTIVIHGCFVHPIRLQYFL